MRTVTSSYPMNFKKWLSFHFSLFDNLIMYNYEVINITLLVANDCHQKHFGIQAE